MLANYSCTFDHRQSTRMHYVHLLSRNQVCNLIQDSFTSKILQSQDTHKNLRLTRKDWKQNDMRIMSLKITSFINVTMGGIWYLYQMKCMSYNHVIQHVRVKGSFEEILNQKLLTSSLLVRVKLIKLQKIVQQEFCVIANMRRKKTNSTLYLMKSYLFKLIISIIYDHLNRLIKFKKIFYI